MDLETKASLRKCITDALSKISKGAGTLDLPKAMSALRPFLLNYKGDISSSTVADVVCEFLEIEVVSFSTFF